MLAIEINPPTSKNFLEEQNMIKVQYYTTRSDGVDLYRTYSDADFRIHKIGTDEIYDEAIDVVGAPFVYEETAEPIEKEGILNE